MSSVVDFLERMGSEAQWRNASPDEIEQALAEATIEAPMAAAILAQSTSDVQALLGQTTFIGMLIPGPSPEEVPDQPEPEKKEDEDEEGEDPGQRKQLKADCGPATMSSTSFLS